MAEREACPCCGGKMDAIEKKEGRVKLKCTECGMSDVRVMAGYRR